MSRDESQSITSGLKGVLSRLGSSQQLCNLIVGYVVPKAISGCNRKDVDDYLGRGELAGKDQIPRLQRMFPQFRALWFVSQEIRLPFVIWASLNREIL